MLLAGSTANGMGIKIGTHSSAKMPQRRSNREFEALYTRLFASGLLDGRSDVTRLPQIGEYFAARLQTVGVSSMDELVTHLVRRGTRAGVYDSMSRFLQNRRSGMVIPFENSPLVDRRALGKTVVFDVNNLAYASVRALLARVSRMTAGQRRGLGITTAVPAALVPPENLNVSLSGRYCAAHHDSEGVCRGERAKNYCNWVANDGGRSNCVPRIARAISAANVGAAAHDSVRAPSTAAKLNQEQFVTGNGPHPPPPVRRGQYAGGWRKPSALVQLPM